ncbi:MAG: DUF2341 domain-containing protein [Candidatus Bathyarchaeota archaeon]|nr:DUF2341 domain-containing protein [Candidatus Bathyarchaeota archaeon]
MKKPNSAAPTALTISTLLLLSLFLVSIPKVESASLVPVIDGNRVYVENADCYISAAPHTLNGDGYVYFNITSKTYQGEVAFCFGFSGNSGYPTSLELYDRREETTRHELDLSPYFDDSACQVGYNYSGKAGEVVYDGYVWVYRRASIVDDKNQTAAGGLNRILLQHYDVFDLDAKVACWNTSQTLYWHSIGDSLNFEKSTFVFQGMDTWYISDYSIQKNRNYYLRMWLTVVPILSDEVHKFFVAFKPSEETLEQAVASKHFCYLDPWYSSSWDYRKSHIIEHAAGAGTLYQIRLVVNYGSGTDSGGVVYLGGKCQPDFDDVRFTDDDGNTLLDYWRESYTSSNSAIFWLEMIDDLSNTDRMFYIYYGNAEVETTSNFDATFIFGEPFDNGTLSTSRWPTAYRTGNPTYWIDSANHFLEVYNMDANNWWNGKGFRSKSFTLPDSWLIESAYGMYQPFWMVHYTETAGEIFGGLFNVEHSDYSPSDYGVAHLSLRDHWAANKDWLYYAGVGGNVDYDSGEQTFFDYVLKTLKIWKLSGYIHVSVDGTTRVTEYNSETANYVHLGIARYSTYDFGLERFYAFRIRKYVADEPDHGAWGPEETRNYASLIWGTGNYNLGPDGEYDESQAVCANIYTYFGNTLRYNKLNNYWGAATQPYCFYNNISYCEVNKEYATLFYKGPIHPNVQCGVPGCTFTHYGVYDWEGDAIKDYEIYSATGGSTSKFDFVFIWACMHGSSNFIGGHSGTHSWGMCHSLMGETNATLSANGYASPDGSGRCFISFDGISINFKNVTGYGSYDYGDFADRFYYYALNGYSINDALDAAARYTHGSIYDYDEIQLYYPTKGYWMDNPQGGGVMKCYMRVWGDGNHVIPC